MLGARYKKIASSCPFGWVGNCNHRAFDYIRVLILFRTRFSISLGAVH
jgi:hypothetical protein